MDICNFAIPSPSCVASQHRPQIIPATIAPNLVPSLDFVFRLAPHARGTFTPSTIHLDRPPNPFVSIYIPLQTPNYITQSPKLTSHIRRPNLALAQNIIRRARNDIRLALEAEVAEQHCRRKNHGGRVGLVLTHNVLSRRQFFVFLYFQIPKRQ